MFTVKGRIVDSNNKPLPGRGYTTRVNYKWTGGGGYTDSNGYYSMLFNITPVPAFVEIKDNISYATTGQQINKTGVYTFSDIVVPISQQPPNKPQPKNNNFFINIYDANTKKPILGATVQIQDALNKKMSAITSANGVVRFNVTLPVNVTVFKSGYTAINSAFNKTEARILMKPINYI